MNANICLRFAAMLCIATCAALGSPAVRAILGQPGTLDSTWVGFAAGKVMTPIGGNDDVVNALVLQADGKVVAAGTCLGGDGSSQFCAARYTETGSLDSSFGNGGKLITSVGAQDDTLKATAIQSDGKIVLAGYCGIGGSPVFCMVRYNSSGTALDSGFGANGRVLTPMSSGGDEANAMVLQPDGKIVLVGGCNIAVQSVFCVARYNGNGSLDTSFDGNGKVSTAIGAEAKAYAVALQANGKIVVAGSCTNSGQKDFCLARYTNGSLDLTFDGNGVLATDVLGGNDIARSIVIQPDGKILVAGSCAAPANTTDFCAARYETNGELDTSFSGNGWVVTQISSDASAVAGVVIQPDGKLVLGGFCGNAFGGVFCALRYNSDGSLDTTFATSGKVTTPVNLGADAARAIANQADGRILLAGICSNGSNDDFCVIRYDGGPFGAQNCTLDIDGDGKVLATTDMLIASRIALGINGSAAMGGITFPAHAIRKTWSSIREYLVIHCDMVLPL
jgi:uncharacterized delta-60 repeat protein